MNKINIARVGAGQAEQFFDLYKTIVVSDFKEWTAKSKKHWLAEDYNIDYWKKLLTEAALPAFAAFDGEKMVGYIAVEGINYGVVYIGWVGVLKGYRGKGIAGRLMAAVEKWAKDKKFHKLELETQIKALLPFFEKQGFTLEGVRKNSWQKLDNYMFGKSISVSS